MLHDKLKPSNLWIQKLFKQPCSGNNVTKKSYFGQRYHDTNQTQQTNPFHALFSDSANEIWAYQTQHTPLSEDSPCIPSEFSDNTLKPPLDQTAGRHLGENSSMPFTVLNCYDETPDTKTFRLGRLKPSVFNYLPGQYVTLSVSIAGQEYKRSYSLASAPSGSGIIDITVKRDPNNGVVSNWLNSHLQIGDCIKLTGPYGKFTCASKIPAKILFLAAGSGIVPVMSMLRWLTGMEARTDIVLLLSFRTFSDIIYRNELDLIAACHSNVQLFITLTQEPQSLNRWQGFTGRIDQNRIAALVPDVPERTVYLCGPDVFMAECKQNLLNLKLPPEKLLCESFTVASAADPSHLNGNPTPIRKPGNYQVKFAKSRKTITTDGTLNLLDLAEKSGIKITHECRSGECGECMVKCLKGKVEMTKDAEIGEFDRKKGWVYACCAYPASNTVLDA